ncbi:hypothetical protein ACUFKU_003610, partial [Vibrio cholerae]
FSEVMMIFEFKVKTDQSFDMTYRFTSELKLLKFRTLIETGGKARIDNKFLEVRDGYLIHYKGNHHKGASYSMPTDGIIETLNALYHSKSQA